MSQPAAALRVLRDLGSPEQMRAFAARRGAPAEPARANTHVHLPPNFSAFESVSQAVGLAADAGLALLGAGNYYDFSVYDEFAEEAGRCGLFPLFGVEVIALLDDLKDAGVRINDPRNPGRMYICGKGLYRFGETSGRARELMARVRADDSTRMAAMIERLRGIFARNGVETGLDEPAVIDDVVRRSGRPRDTVTLQERHVALAFREAFFGIVPQRERRERLGAIFGAPVGDLDAAGVQSEIRARLMKAGGAAFVEEKFLDFDDAFELVLELGGIPCYPVLADGAKEICAFEQPVEKLIERIRRRGFQAAEFIPVRNRPRVLADYVAALRAAGLVVTAGTEHNTLELLPLEPTAGRGRAIPGDIGGIFWEGACVAAAHQYLGASGECGFVDSRGRPNRAYGGAEERIEAFARLGAAVIERFRGRAARQKENR